jgi:hypothetical protein
MLEIAEILIPAHFRGGGKCKHVRCGEDVTDQITSIALVEYEPNSGYYLLYRGPLGEELNDLFFESTQEAVDQLEFEFGEAVSTKLATGIAMNSS